MNHQQYLIRIPSISRRLCIALALLFATRYSVGAQQVLTLSQAIKDAIGNRKNIQAGKSDQEIRKLQTEALYRKYWPQVNVDYAYRFNPILQTSILPIGLFNPSYPADATKGVQFGTKWSQTAGLTLSQPLIDVSLNRQINEAKLQQRITAASQAQTEYDLAYTVAQVYVDINLMEAKVRSAIADTDRTWISYQVLQNKFEQKRLLKSELNKARINHNNTTQQFRNTLSQLIEDKVCLFFLMGRNDIENPDITIDTSFLLKWQLAGSNEQPNFSNIPELQELQLKGDLVGVQAKTEKTKYLPTVSAKGFIGANQYTNTFDPFASNSWFGLSYVGIDLRYPILFGEDRRRKLQQLQLQSTQYYQRKEDRTAEYIQDGLIAKIRMDQVQHEMKVQEENIALYKESIAIFQARVSEGQESSSNLNVEEAELQKLDANYQSNRRQYWLYFLDYLKASGKLEVLWKH